jgi:hypothetical protein
MVRWPLKFGWTFCYSTSDIPVKIINLYATTFTQYEESIDGVFNGSPQEAISYKITSHVCSKYVQDLIVNTLATCNSATLTVPVGSF